jgi:hypothetical protein
MHSMRVEMSDSSIKSSFKLIPDVTPEIDEYGRQVPKASTDSREPKTLFGAAALGPSRRPGSSKPELDALPDQNSFLCQCLEELFGHFHLPQLVQLQNNQDL